MKRDPEDELDHPAIKRSVPERVAFGLLDLPQDLLEELTLYFRTSQAAKVITVSSKFHDVFARRIWRYLTTAVCAKCMLIPASAWQRYGHLVRRLPYSLKLGSGIPLEHFTDIVHLSMFSSSLDTVFSQHINTWHNLQHVKINYSDGYLDSKRVGFVTSWVKSALEREQRVKFEWIVKIVSHEKLHRLCMMVNDFAADGDGGGNDEMHSLVLVVQDLEYPASTNQLSDVAKLVKDLRFCNHKSFIRLLGSNSVVFPQLSNLKLNSHNISPDATVEQLSRIVPDRFPSLQKVTLGYNSNRVSADIPIFAHAWTSVTELVLDECCDPKDILLGHIFKCFPNVIRLVFTKSRLLVEIGMLSAHLPLLQSLSFDSTSSDLDNVLGGDAVLPHLTELSISWPSFSSTLTELQLECLSLALNCAPSLQSLKLLGCLFPKNILEIYEGRQNQKVRSLVISSCADQENDERIERLLQLFPNTRRLGLHTGGAENVAALKTKYPNLCVYRS
ncbi:hypothetical protein GQ42DRAFT_180723 [Ramicandelaber brevisporus]|nr:hypothetical protein GQ42DRAFT_180723 [Ramicandelaber brevisporus]